MSEGGAVADKSEHWPMCAYVLTDGAEACNCHVEAVPEG